MMRSTEMLLLSTSLGTLLPVLRCREDVDRPSKGSRLCMYCRNIVVL